MVDVSHMDLRQLARAYHDGLLEIDQYRSARTQLLDRVTGEPTTRLEPRPSRSRPAAPVSGPVQDNAGAKRSYASLLAWTLVLLAVLFGLAFWLVRYAGIS